MIRFKIYLNNNLDLEDKKIKKEIEALGLEYKGDKRWVKKHKKL